MNFKFIGACTSLGVNINGSEKSPFVIYTELKKYYNNSIFFIQNKQTSKNIDVNNKQKNLFSLNRFNQKAYSSIFSILQENSFPLTLGGDHSITIASALASIKKYNNLGIIWIDAHGDYNNCNTTPSGNIHGFPFAAITAFPNTCNLTKFHNGNFFNPRNSVLVGARDLDVLEIQNLKKAGITIFTTQDLKDKGIEKIMQKALKIAATGTNGIHVSFDIDIIDPSFVPGISTASPNGLSEDDAYEIMNILNQNLDIIKSLDLVEYNPKLDIDCKGLDVAINLIKIFTDTNI